MRLFGLSGGAPCIPRVQKHCQFRVLESDILRSKVVFVLFGFNRAYEVHGQGGGVCLSLSVCYARELFSNGRFFLNLFTPPGRPATWLCCRKITKIFTTVFAARRCKARSMRPAVPGCRVGNFYVLISYQLSLWNLRPINRKFGRQINLIFTTG